MAEKSKTSAWLYVAIGCAGMLVLIVGAVAGGIFMVYRWGKNLEQTMTDPVARTARVRSTLGVEQFPEGYQPGLAFKIPLVGDIAVLSDQESTQDGGPQFDERGFIYLKLSSWVSRRKHQELKDYVQGKRASTDVTIQSNIQIDGHEILHQDEIELDGARLTFSVRRASVGMHGRAVDGLATLMLLDCPQDANARFGIWFGSREHGAADEPPEPAASERAVRDFLGHFDLCG